MKLSRNSWHYRLIKYCTPNAQLVDGELPYKDFCSYFWHLLVLIIIGLPMVLFLTILVSPFFLLCWIADKRDEWRMARQLKKADPDNPNTLIGKWLKAKKDKVCPIIEWTE